MCSTSSHNAVHIDPHDSSPSFAIFYQEEKGVGMSYFAFPKIGLLIQLKTPVLLSWDGFKTKHCSVAMTNGITSMFGCSMKQIDKQLAVEKLFRYQPKRRKLNKLCIGNLVYVQEHLKGLIYRDAGLKNYHFPGNPYSSRKAVVISIDETCTLIHVKYCSLGLTLVVDRQLLPVVAKVSLDVVFGEIVHTVNPERPHDNDSGSAAETRTQSTTVSSVDNHELNFELLFQNGQFRQY